MVRKTNRTGSSTHSDEDAAAADSMGSRFAKTAAGLMDSELAASVKASAQQIWLAGMGAFAKAQAEGGKVFETLVKEGINLQQKTQGAAEETLGDVTSKVSAMADTVTAKAGQNWDKLEAIFEQRTDKALGRLGVPRTKDLDALAQRVDALAATVAELGRQVRAARAGAAKKVAAKTAVKSAVKTANRTPARTAASKAAGKRLRMGAAD